MKQSTIAFVGGGNMGRSFIGGLVADGMPPDALWVADPSPEKRAALSAAYRVHATDDNLEAVAAADVIVLAVKPQALKQVCNDIAAGVRDTRRLVVSIAAGVREASIREWLGEDVAIVRAMPNTPALVQSGATALYANPHVDDKQRDAAETIMRAVGLTVWLDDEADMDTVTALSGSGPAYFFLVMEALEHAATELGLAPETARLLTLQTAFGAAKMALESDDEAADLRVRVTSPGGTTERALEVLQEGRVEELFARALRAARDRSAELADILGNK